MHQMWVLSLGWEDPLEEEPTPVFLSGESHGQRSLEGYSLWGCKRVRHDLATSQQQKKERWLNIQWCSGKEERKELQRGVQCSGRCIDLETAKVTYPFSVTSKLGGLERLLFKVTIGLN